MPGFVPQLSLHQCIIRQSWISNAFT